MYNAAMSLYAVIMRIAALFHSKAEKMLDGQKQTFSVIRSEIDRGSSYIWVHAASLGEFEQGRPLMEAIKNRCPSRKILLTFFSPSGYEIRKNYAGADIICYLPFDTKRNVKRFLDAARPEKAVFIKYEFWLNYLTELHHRQIPVYIISARFRPGQIFFRSYGGMFRKALACFEKIFVQDQSSKDLLAGIHVTDQVIISGDTRFDRVLAISRQTKTLPIAEKFGQNASFVLTAGSSWPKDEEIVLAYFNRHPEIKLIIAPHEIHEERLSSIERMSKRPVLRYSSATEQNITNADCLIIDCFGILSSVYRYGNAAYIGGGFGVGIHNILEAAVYGIPVLFGPNYKKFKEAGDLIEAGGGFSVKNYDEFDNRLSSFIQNKEYLQITGRKSGDYVNSQVGATEIILGSIDVT
ncbi:MAG: 3-deoxy-D-manno-octulosonic acid transferase [Candidatus Azobacteroides sp.]|nr:3-deoxy-D-manno-octulosonic acid transferase [Candidatus Azobacteroides sp.]